MGLAESLNFRERKQTAKLMWDLRTAQSLLERRIPLPIGSQHDLVDLAYALMAREGKYALGYALAKVASGINIVDNRYGIDRLPIYEEETLQDVLQTWAIVSRRKTALKALRAFNKTFSIGMKEETPNG